MVYIACAFLASGLIASVSAGSAHALHRSLHKRGGDYAAPAYGAPSYGAPSYSSASAIPSLPPASWYTPSLPPVSYPSAPVEACSYSTYTSTWYGQPGLVPPPVTYETPSPTSYATPTSYVAPTSSAPAPPEYTPSSSSSTPPPPPPSTYSKPAPAPSVYVKPAAPVAPPKTPDHHKAGGIGNIIGGGVGSIVPNGNKWAMAYTPYAESGDCKSASDVMSDLGQIKAKGFTTVRLYATDCSGVENVGAACEAHGLKMIMGIYIDGSGLSNAYAQLGELTSWGQSNGWDKVEMVVAGNEAVFNGYTSASELAGFIGDVKSKFKAAGYSGPVTTTEPLGTIQENASTFCGAVDVIAANIHPFFNGGIGALGAGAFVTSQMALLSQACGGAKEAYNLETGWPSQGSNNGAAIPGLSEQKLAVDSIMAAAGSKSALFSFENDMWKAPGEFGVEQYWGCAQLFQD